MLSVTLVRPTTLPSTEEVMSEALVGPSVSSVSVTDITDTSARINAVHERVQCGAFICSRNSPGFEPGPKIRGLYFIAKGSDALLVVRMLEHPPEVFLSSFAKASEGHSRRYATA